MNNCKNTLFKMSLVLCTSLLLSILCWDSLAQNTFNQSNTKNHQLSKIEKLLIYEVLFKELLNKLPPEKLTIFFRFVSPNDSNLSVKTEKELLIRFLRLPYPVVSARDKKKFINKGASGYLDGKTGNRGVVIIFHELTVNTPSTVSIEGGWRNGGRSGKNLRFTLSKKLGNWMVSNQITIGKV